MRAEHILSFFFPNICTACGGPAGSSFCPDCITEITMQPAHSCVRCGVPLPDGGAHCADCRLSRDPSPCERIIPVGIYEGKMRKVIGAYKYRNRDYLCRPLGKLLARRIAAVVPEARYDMILPVPLHWTKKAWRGYDQSGLLAFQVGECLHIPCNPRILARRRFTLPQSFLNRASRRRNIAGAFAMREHVSVKGKRLLLIDDVCTTGSTVRACAAVLKMAGAASVIAGVLARDPHPHRTT